ncbi:50S ribosomal protein L16 [bioreactor metagenome]|uniref:50S ribosomal protein L16 n=1 Tax=bioreactor metagenome TaxID=1076179 RepID=A0A644T6G0_9ZZZZ|nr:50S ribosomal protein L16 [Candidatus Elulimicrobiales bacterium]
MLFPKKVKHRKWQSARSSLKKAARPETKGVNVDFGSFGLKAETDKRITSNQIEAARRAMVRYGGKTAKFWIRVFPDRPFTQKGAEVPMGKGKGDPKGYCVEVRPGRIIFEIDGVTEDVAREALRKAGTKLPIKTKVVARV